VAKGFLFSLNGACVLFFFRCAVVLHRFCLFSRRNLNVVLFSLFASSRNEVPLTEEEYRSAFKEYYKSIRYFIYYKCSDEDLAEDIAQDTFAKLWENREKIDRKTLKAYLYTIANNLMINQMKRRQLHFKFQSTRTSLQDDKDASYALEMEQFDERLQKVLAAIPDGAREVFLMNRLEDMKYREIADRLGISIKAVEKRMSKALSVIREQLNIEL
jgi:RNA polymerase sigma-70 factor (ECF subfamily)